MCSNNNRPLIAMVANYPKGTGYAWWLMERFWDEIATTAVTRGWQSMIVFPQSPYDENAEWTLPNPSQLETFLSKGSLKDVPHVYKLIRYFNIHSLYLTDRPFRNWKYFLFRLAGIKSIVVHDHTPGDRPAIKGIKGLIKKLLNYLPWFTASLYIAISPLMRQRHLLNARIPAARIATVTNGIVVRDLIPNARELLTQKFRLPPDCYIVCAIGRLNAYKRFDFAIKCVGELCHENPDSKPVLLLIGDGPDRPRLASIADSLGPECRVIFTGQLENVWSVLCGVDTVIHPSAGEGMSLAILEAMAAARPVIVPRLPSVSQTIEHGSTGLIYQEGSLDEAKRFLYLLSSDHTYRNTLGTNARQKVLKQYQLERTVKDFKNTILPALFQH
jgi:glycosyltransferase involved in cell wall biosynthesis